MTFLSPLALLWLGSLPVLLWLWRLASTRRRIRIPSLVPFEHLLRRAPRRRTRLVVNALFWLQLAMLILLALALAAPILLQRRAETLLVVMDTSASMGARRGRTTMFERAQRALLDRLAKKDRTDHVLIVTSGPVTTPMEQPHQDLDEIKQVLSTLRVSHLAGNLTTATHIGRAMLGGVVDRTLIVTDESPPPTVPADVEFLTVGEALPNVAVVGFDARGGFCSETSAHLMVMVHNFSDERSDVRVEAQQGRRRVAEASVSLEAGERTSVSLTMPDDSDGLVDVVLAAQRDALKVDSRAQVLLRRISSLPVAVVSDRPAFQDLIGEWLDACDGLVWAEGLPAEASGPSVVVTDGDVPSGQLITGTLQWLPSGRTRGTNLAHWTVHVDHPIGSYLSPVEVVGTSLDTGLSAGFFGEPGVWRLFEGQKTPLVLASEQDARRKVLVRVDPVDSPDSIPLLMVFLNSLRWLMGHSDVVHTGVDPIESNLMERISTWQPTEVAVSASEEAPRTRRSLDEMLAALILALVLCEWWLYSKLRR